MRRRIRRLGDRHRAGDAAHAIWEACVHREANVAAAVARIVRIDPAVEGTGGAALRWSAQHRGLALLVMVTIGAPYRIGVHIADVPTVAAVRIVGDE